MPDGRTAALLAGTGGLGLTWRRLTALYGSRASIAFEHRADGFAVVLGLPVAS